MMPSAMQLIIMVALAYPCLIPLSAVLFYILITRTRPSEDSTMPHLPVYNDGDETDYNEFIIRGMK